ncbi:capreomycidine synthase [Dactylosporangium sp. McL0621]|uniref:capreomycidine synthase n=1 Tax=Dactylosporangium sp. McL0621 TaxID=3415678 RepID=UPI003CF6780A
MRLSPAPLEDWLRDYYFTAQIDISSSGVEPYTMAQLRELTGIRPVDIDRLVFDDGYSLGRPELRRVIAQAWGDGDPDKVMTTNGSSEAISLVLSALLSPGDEVVVVQPGYHLLVEYAAGLGCRLRTWRIDPANGWRPSLDELDELVTDRTRAIVVNFPQNPTGATITRDELDRLVAIADGAGAYMLWDAAFASLVYDADPLPPISALYGRGIDFGTFSKAFGLPGLRFGWCIAPPDLLADCVRIRDYTTLHVAPLIELLALGVLEHADAFLAPRLAQARGNRDLVAGWAAAESARVELQLLGGGAATFPKLLGMPSTDAFCDDLFNRLGVLVIPGSCFGVPEHVRLGYGGPTSSLVEGLERFSTALSEWFG